MNEWKPAEQVESNPEAGETSKLSTSSEAEAEIEVVEPEPQPGETIAPQIDVVFLAAAEKDLLKIGRGKHQAQIVRKIDELENNPLPADAKAIRGEKYKANGWNFYRVDVGEYRIVYDLDEQSQLLTVITIAVIGARNDDKVYKLMERRFS